MATYNVALPPVAGRRVEFLLRNLLRCAADIVCLQEVAADCPLCAALQASHPHQLRSPGNDARGIQLAICSRYPIVESRSHRDLSFAHLYRERPTRFSRDLLRAEIQVGEERWNVYTTHLKSMRGGSLTHGQRESEAAAIAALIGAQMTPGQPFLLTGDFNDGRDSPSTRRLLGGPFDLRNSLEVYPARRTETFPTQGARYQFDYILCPGSLAARLEHSQVWPESRASDHALVSARFTGP